MLYTTPETGYIYGTIECPNMKAQFYPDPYDCSAYHFCNAGKDKVLTCEPGLYYDRSRDVCDWKKNVNCTDSVFFLLYINILLNLQTFNKGKHVCPSNGERLKFVHGIL